MERICLIGNFGGNRIGGQITKTCQVIQALEKRYGKIQTIDVYAFGGNYLKLMWNIFLETVKAKKVVIILASPGYFRLLPMISVLNIFLKRDVYEFVIGGVRYQYIEGKKLRIRFEKKIRKIYVESHFMKQKYQQMGISNVEVIPNFKDFSPLSEDSMLEKYTNQQGLRLCTFSRIDKLKGLDLAIAIVKAANRMNGTKDICLDIYGPIEKTYQGEFDDLLKNSDSEIINYLGIVENSNAINILARYDALLFPTKWKTEGFPGTFIDAMAAGLPILATNLPNFTDCILKGYNGYLIDDFCIDEYVKRINTWRTDKEKLLQMKKNSLSEAKKYNASVALKVLWKDLEQ